MKKLLTIVLIAALAVALAACSSDSEGGDAAETAEPAAAAETVPVDTTGMTKEEVATVAHIYFDMYPTRTAFYGASAEDITKLSNDMIAYLDSQTVTNPILAGYVADFRSVYASAAALGADSENTELQAAVEDASTRTSDNVVPLRTVCDQFGVQWVYFWQEEAERGGVYYTFKDKDSKEIKDDNGNLTGNKWMRIEVAAKNLTSNLNNGWDLINFQLVDAVTGETYQIDREKSETKTIVDANIEMGKKARAVLFYEVPDSLNLYTLVLDMSSWNDESNQYLRMAHYTLF